MTNLITIDEFKTYKGINSETEDPTISLLIGAVSNFVKEYIGRELTDYAHTPVVEYFDAISYGTYQPEVFPILEVTELSVSTDGGVTYTVLVENTDYFVDTDNDSIISNTGLVGFVTSTIKHHSGKLTYRGGYARAPNDIRLAVMDLVHYYRKEEYLPGKTMGSASMDNPTIVLTGSQLPAHIKRVLDLYRVL